MQGITITRQVTLNLSAARWELYVNKPCVNTVADRINREVEAILNAAADRGEAYSSSYKVLEKYSKYGATDTEPVWVLRDILDKVFPL